MESTVNAAESIIGSFPLPDDCFVPKKSTSGERLGVGCLVVAVQIRSLAASGPRPRLLQARSRLLAGGVCASTTGESGFAGPTNLNPVPMAGGGCEGGGG